MFILGINGSANSDGSTAYLLKEALTTARDYGAGNRVATCSRDS